jgi:hypothetical protein
MAGTHSFRRGQNLFRDCDPQYSWVVLPVITGIAQGNASAGVVGALGALNVSYSDSRDPYITRARRMLFSSVLVGVAVSMGRSRVKAMSRLFRQRHYGLLWRG